MLTVQQLSKSFGSVQAISEVSFTLPTESILAVIGPSGCGKSTLLSIIAGLVQPESGDILWNDQSLQGRPPHTRGFGLMFQDYALFPHLTVGDNVAFGLRDPNKQRVASEMLARVGLAGFEKRDVQTLSGGEQQRVALARALAPQPKLLMLDEPLGALDRALREQLTVELRTLLREFKQTAIYVTHDQQEAFGIADQILILNNGRVEQVGTPTEVYTTPVNTFVRKFLGPGQILRGRIEKNANEQLVIRTELGPWPLPATESAAAPGDEVLVLIRAEGIRLL